MFLTILCGIIAAWVFWSIASLELNMRKASKIGVRCVRLPIDGNNVLWMTFEPFVWKLVDSLPFAWSSYPDFIRYLRRGWHFYEKSDSHARHGAVWALVSPVGINLHFSDPDAIGEVFSRRRDFIRPVENYSKPAPEILRGQLTTSRVLLLTSSQRSWKSSAPVFRPRTQKTGLVTVKLLLRLSTRAS